MTEAETRKIDDMIEIIKDGAHTGMYSISILINSILEKAYPIVAQEFRNECTISNDDFELLLPPETKQRVIEHLQLIKKWG